MGKSRIQQAPIVGVFAQRLKGARLALGLSQLDLATQAQVTASYISRLEAGGAAPGIDLLERLAQALKVPIADLLPTREENSETQQEKVRQLFESVIRKAGPETLSMLKALFTRLAEASSGTR